jgi:hypothetical protein
MFLYFQRYKISKSYFIHYWRICFVKINSGSLRKTLCNQSALYLTTSLFSFLFWTKTHLNPTEKVLRGVGITSVNTFYFLSELNSASIVSFYLLHFECFLHSGIVLGSGLFRKFSAMIVEKHMSAIVVLRSYTFSELV